MCARGIFLNHFQVFEPLSLNPKFPVLAAMKFSMNTDRRAQVSMLYS